MINSVEIKNVQSHEHTKVELSPGVNAFIGASDSGKSAVLRAINWAALNRPQGDALRSRWGGDTSVKIELDGHDGASVYRGKDKVGNRYVLSLPEPGGDIEFKAMGADVPAEVQKALNLLPINLQYQLDSPFLLSSDWSPGRVAEYLNDAVGLDAIDRAMANINSKVSRIKADTDAEGLNNKKLRQDAEGLAYVDELDARVAALEAVAAQAGRVRAAEQGLHNVCAEITSTWQRIDAQPDYMRAATRVDALIGDAERRARINKQAEDLRQQVANINALREKIDALDHAVRAERLVNKMLDAARQSKELDDRRAELEALLAGVHESEEMLARNKEALAKLDTHWLRMAPDVCPLCGMGKLR